MKRKKYTYIPKDEIESITTWNGKNITQDKILDGAYVRGNVKYAHGGIPKYVSKTVEGRMKEKLTQILNEMSESQLDMVADKYDVQGDLGIWVVMLPNNKVEDVLMYSMSVLRGDKYAHGGKVNKGYDVMVWETEEDRERGDSFRHGNYMEEQDAINMAKRLFLRNGYACVEVIDRNRLRSDNEMRAHDSMYSDEIGVVIHLCDDDEYAHGGMMEDGGEVYTKSVEEQAQEMLGNRFFELNPQEREDIINSFIADGVITPRVTYTQFEEESFEYAGGGGVATASYKVIYQMVGSKDKKEKIFTDKTKAELFAETMEEDEDVKSVKLEEVVEKSEKASKSKATPTINLFGAAKTTTTTASKTKKPTVEIDGIGDDIARYNELKAVMNNAKAEQELIGGRIKEAGLEKYLEMYEQTGRNPPNFEILSEGNNILFMVKDAYIKNISPELQEMLEEYGEGLVEVVNTYSFNTDVLEKKVKGNKTVGDIVNELIIKSTDIPQEDKMNLIVPSAEARIPKGTIDRLADYDSIEEVFNLVKPQLALK